MISERATRTHVCSLLAEFGLSSQTQAVLWTVREGLVSASLYTPP